MQTPELFPATIHTPVSNTIHFASLLCSNFVQNPQHPTKKPITFKNPEECTYPRRRTHPPTALLQRAAGLGVGAPPLVGGAPPPHSIAPVIWSRPLSFCITEALCPRVRFPGGSRLPLFRPLLPIQPHRPPPRPLSSSIGGSPATRTTLPGVPGVVVCVVCWIGRPRSFTSGKTITTKNRQRGAKGRTFLRHRLRITQGAENYSRARLEPFAMFVRRFCVLVVVRRNPFAILRRFSPPVQILHAPWAHPQYAWKIFRLNGIRQGIRQRFPSFLGDPAGASNYPQARFSTSAMQQRWRRGSAPD